MALSEAKMEVLIDQEIIKNMEVAYVQERTVAGWEDQENKS